MFRSVEAYSFQEDIETTSEISRCSKIGCVFHGTFANCRSTTCYLSPGMAQWFLSTMTASVCLQYERTNAFPTSHLPAERLSSGLSGMIRRITPEMFIRLWLPFCKDFVRG